MGGYDTSEDDKEDSKGDVGDPAETGNQMDMSSEMGNEQEGGYMNIGGLASKPKKKKQKKKKRSGLASR